MRRFSLIYTALLLLGSVAGAVIMTLSEYGIAQNPGCNFYDALLYGVECRGFWGAKVIAAIVSFPLLVWQASAMSAIQLTSLPLVLILWAPVLHVLYLGLSVLVSGRTNT